MNFRYVNATFCAFLLAVLNTLAAQNMLTYSFDNCQLNEQNNKTTNLINSAPLTCTCGIQAEAIVGNGQSLRWPVSIDSMFRNDFSLGFAVKINNQNGEVDLFSKSRRCNADTVLSITYRTRDSLFVFNIREGFDEALFFTAKAAKNACWQQVFLVKNLGTYRVYINGVLATQELTNDLIRLDDSTELIFNASPCLANSLTPFEGRLDQVIITDYSLKSFEVLDLFQPQQEIISNDTTIFLGNSVNLLAVSNCPVNILWTPSIGLSNPNILNPVATPLLTTSYTAKFQFDGCLNEDSVLIRIIDRDKLECDKLKLPTAFTPNEDGLNDEFGISNYYLIDKLEYFDILDRNGGKIATFNNPTDRWDGSWSGKPLNPGSYFYRVGYICKDETYTKRGSVQMIR
ncbi:MAG: gliding motility-associated C-terminal domain-containing protein [Bacteroidota bacterium]|nr:gliding motility-associated C-terminal domain-containing protein [Bacteroidota bacterium]